MKNGAKIPFVTQHIKSMCANRRKFSSMVNKIWCHAQTHKFLFLQKLHSNNTTALVVKWYKLSAAWIARETGDRKL